MAHIIVRRDGRLTLPRKVREAAGLAAGEALSVEVTDEGVLLRKVDEDHDPSDWRYWSKVAPYDGPRGRVFYSEEEFEAFLDSVGYEPEKAE